MAAGLEVFGHLTILADDESRLRVEFRDDVVALKLPDLRTALALRRRLPRPRRRAWLQRLVAESARAGLELQIWIGGRQVGRLAADARPCWIAARLGLDPMELRVRPILAMLVRQPLAPDASQIARAPRDGRAEPSS